MEMYGLTYTLYHHKQCSFIVISPFLDLCKFLIVNKKKQLKHLFHFSEAFGACH